MSLKAICERVEPSSKFLIAIGSFLFFYVFFPLLSAFIASRIYGFSVLSLAQMDEASLGNVRFVAALNLMQVISSICSFTFLSFLLAYIFGSTAVNYLCLNKKIGFVSGALVIIALITSLPLINFLGELNSHLPLPGFFKELEDKAALATKAFLEMHSVSDMLFNVFMIGLLPALGEELLFRGIIQRIISEWSKNVHTGIWMSAVLFSAMHMQFYGFVPRMLLGALFGYLLVWSGSLWLPILAHFVNNASAVLFTYLFNEKIISLDPDKIGVESDYSAVLISVLLTSVLLWLVFRKEKKQNPALR